MEQVIEKMLRAFETGKLTRRELVRALAAFPAAAGTAAGQLATLPRIRLSRAYLSTTSP
jgi:hypothetical protein